MTLCILSSKKENTIKILIVTTVPETLFYAFEEQIPFFLSHGMSVAAITSPGTWISSEDVVAKYRIPVYIACYTRHFSPLKDIMAFFTTIRLVLKLTPKIIHASTPKASLICLLASRIACVPLRIYTIRGLLFTGRGIRSRLFKMIDRIACSCAHIIYAVSESNRRIIIENRICSAGKIRVIGSGSSHGVDARKKYDPDMIDRASTATLRLKYSITTTDVVYGFIGRIVRDKGVEDLLAAWVRMAERYENCRLLIVGPLAEPRDCISAASLGTIRTHRRIHHAEETKYPGSFYCIMDVFILPSYREGFPNVILEAGAMRLPVITTTAPGCVDSVVDGVTGFRYPTGDVNALLTLMETLHVDREKRLRIGTAAREYVINNFNPEDICRQLYQDIITTVTDKK